MNANIIGDEMVKRCGLIWSSITEVSMAEYQVKRTLRRKPVHPGEIMREDMLPAVTVSATIF